MEHRRKGVPLRHQLLISHSTFEKCLPNNILLFPTARFLQPVSPQFVSPQNRNAKQSLRRFLQGLDPKSTANLFSNSVCIGEKSVYGEDCFILKLEAESSSLKARSTNNVEIMKHTVWGYFSQKTGLLVKLEDSHLLRIKASANDNIFWETTMESLIQDYRTIDGINIAHKGRTWVSLFRFGDDSSTHSRTRMEESWTIEEVDFNIKGLSMDCFLPPSDLKKEEDGGVGCGGAMDMDGSNARLPFVIRSASTKIRASKVSAVDVDHDSETTEDDEEL